MKSSLHWARTGFLVSSMLLGAAGSGCKADADGLVCELPDDGMDVDFAQRIGCRADYDRLAATPLSTAKSGAVSAKTVLDTIDDEFYVQNSDKYPIHWEFAFQHLSGMGKPIVPQLADFNMSEYYTPDRRFLLGAITYYEGPEVWTYEISPYDTATAEMIERAYVKITENTYFGNELYFHPTSEGVGREAENLPDSVKIITTEELYADQEYQILNTGETYAQVRFVRAADLETDYLSFRELAILDSVPNDISVVSGIITQEFQTPLSHINVLSQNRGTPNMGLRDAWDHEELRALEGKWAHLVIEADGWRIEETTREEADAWWEANRPAAVQVPGIDLSVTELTDMADLLDSDLSVAEAIDKAIPAFGGKASNYAVLPKIGGNLNPPRAFAVPVYYYDQFLRENGFDTRIAAMLEDPAFNDDVVTRDAMLLQLRDDMRAAPLNAEFEQLLLTKLEEDYPGIRMRFRSSTNAEDLDGFTGAGLYTSKSAVPGSVDEPVADAVRKVWASVWFFRAFEERSYRSIDHLAVGMSLLVHRSFPDEEANGVALTANIFDTTGAEPGFYINVQQGEASVVKPEPGVTSDQFIYHFDFPGQPIVSIVRSNLVPPGETVLTFAQTYELGKALKDIHTYFSTIYPPNANGWYAMDVEFKFDDIGEYDEPILWVKQARPHPGLGN
ncbi:MAG: PEP/pyruvate-binding domain-containing protein [Myxococcota bacterium]